MSKQPPRIQILSVPSCPLVAKVQGILKDCLQHAQIEATAEVVVGDYNSPTLLVNGFDVTGCTESPTGQISCRLDLPSEGKILAALRVLPLFDNHNASEKAILSRSLQLLFASGKPVGLSEIREATNLPDEVAEKYTQQMHESGLLRLDNANQQLITASAGLSVSPTKHQILIEGRRFWAWCALDILGIFGIYNASGSATSHDPETDRPIHIEFVNGSPVQADSTVISLLGTSHISSLCGDWCPSVHFFVSKSAGEKWLERNSLNGSIVSIHDVTSAAREAWGRIMA